MSDRVFSISEDVNRRRWLLIAEDMKRELDLRYNIRRWMSLGDEEIVKSELVEL